MNIFRFGSISLTIVCLASMAAFIFAQEQPRYLIVHADDAGMSHSVNVATQAGLESGIVTSASVMVPCPWFKEFAEYAKTHPQYDYGIHLTLNSEWDLYRWGPVASRDRVPSLVDATGSLWDNVGQVAMNASAKEVKIELTAQIDRALAFGVPLSHLDTHMGAVLCRPDLVEVYVDLAIAYDLPILFFKRMAPEMEKEYPALAERFHRSVLKLTERKLPLLDNLLQFYGGNIPEQRKQHYYDEIAKIGPGVTQLIIHCGHDDEELRAITDSSLRRNQDRMIFTDQAMQDFLNSQKIKLVSWKQFRRLDLNEYPDIRSVEADLIVPTITYPDHSQLLVVRDTTGSFRPVKTKADWAERVSHIRANMQLVMGKLPDLSLRVPLDLEVVSDEQLPKYRRQKILFTPEPNDRVPAWLLIPNELPESGKIAAMVCLHQTTNIGKDEPAGLGGNSSLHYAHELAERGYLCLVPDYPSFGEYAYDFKTKGANYASGSMKAIWNNIRAVDLLESMPQVDKNRIGAIGHSLGGHNCLFTAVFDERLKAVVSSCGFTPFHDYYNGKLAGWTSDRYMPRIRDIYENNADRVPFDFYEIIAALAPRGLYSNSPVNDDNFDVGGVRKAFAKAEDVYALFTIPQSGPSAMPLMLSTPNAPHDFPKSERDAAYDWLDRMLAQLPQQGF